MAGWDEGLAGWQGGVMVRVDGGWREGESGWTGGLRKTGRWWANDNVRMTGGMTDG